MGRGTLQHVPGFTSMNTLLSPDQIQPGELVDATNLDLVKRTLRRRDGLSELWDGDPTVLGRISQVNGDGAGSTEVDLISPNSFSDISTTFCLIVNGCGSFRVSKYESFDVQYIEFSRQVQVVTYKLDGTSRTTTHFYTNPGHPPSGFMSIMVLGFFTTGYHYCVFANGRLLDSRISDASFFELNGGTDDVIMTGNAQSSIVTKGIVGVRLFSGITDATKSTFSQLYYDSWKRGLSARMWDDLANFSGLSELSPTTVVMKRYAPGTPIDDPTASPVEVPYGSGRVIELVAVSPKTFESGLIVSAESARVQSSCVARVSGSSIHAIPLPISSSAGVVIYRTHEAFDYIAEATPVNYWIDRPLPSKAVQFGRYTLIPVRDRLLKFDGNVVAECGIEPPDTAPTLSLVGGSLSGTFKYVYTYFNSIYGTESNPSPATTAVPSSQNVQVKIPTVFRAINATHVRIYRTVDGGADYFYLAQVREIACAPSAGTAVVAYTDSTTDAFLRVETIVATDNDHLRSPSGPIGTYKTSNVSGMSPISYWR